MNIEKMQFKMKFGQSQEYQILPWSNSYFPPVLQRLVGICKKDSAIRLSLGKMLIYY